MTIITKFSDTTKFCHWKFYLLVADISDIIIELELQPKDLKIQTDMIPSKILSVSTIVALATSFPLAIVHTLTETITFPLAVSCSDIRSKSSPNPSSTISFPSLFDRDTFDSHFYKRASTYVVSAGDFGYAIATKLGISFSSLEVSNPGTDWSNLQIGQTLQYGMSGSNSQTTYTILGGDIGYSIANKFGISFDTLSTANPQINWTNLQIGQQLQIPVQGGSGGSLTVPPTTVPSTTPVGPGTTIATTTATSGTTYVVLAGDTGNMIAQKYGISFEALAGANSGVNWNNLQVGQILNIPNFISQSATTPSSITRSSTATPTATSVESSTTYQVMAGDTGQAIATKFGISYDDLAAANPGVIWTNLQIGQTLQLPQPSTHPATSTTTGTTLSTSSLLATTSAIQNTYTVVAGDTGYIIAAKLGTSFDSLAQANPSVVWTNLQIGQVLVSPISGSFPATSQTISQGPSNTYITKTAQVTGDRAVLKVQNQDSNTQAVDRYVYYTGDGSSWPPISSWTSFQQMWDNMRSVIGKNCVGGVQPNSDAETDSIYDAIQAVAAVSFLDHRMILAIITQESSGCVRVPTTYSPAPDNIQNPGLMQSFRGTGTCNVNGVQTIPCPASTIYQMVVDGSMGSVGGNGIVQNVNRASGSGAQAFYQAARYYNSGSIPPDGNLSGAGATSCFASDIANRLTGWVLAPKQCP